MNAVLLSPGPAATIQTEEHSTIGGEAAEFAQVELQDPAEMSLTQDLANNFGQMNVTDNHHQQQQPDTTVFQEGELLFFSFLFFPLQRFSSMGFSCASRRNLSS